MTLNFTSGTVQHVAYIISANEFVLMTDDANSNDLLLNGSALRQPNPNSFSTASIVGPDILSVGGASGTGPTGVIGAIATASAVSGTPTFTIHFDLNDGGNVTLNQTKSGSYTMAANGRAQVSGSSGSIPLILYMSVPDRGLALTPDAAARFGQLEPQVGAPFSAVSITGSYAFGTRELLAAGAGNTTSGVATISGSTINVTKDQDKTGGNLFFDETEIDSVTTFGTNGRLLLSDNNVAYLISKNKWVVVDIDPTTTNPNLTDVLSIATPAASAAVLSITKTHTGSFTQGQEGATYTVTASNATTAGPTSGTVTVTETIPSGLTLESMAGTGWSCEGTSCTRSDALEAGASYPAITVTVDVASNATSPQVNRVGVTGGGSRAANAQDSTTITIFVGPTLVSIAVTPNPATVSALGTLQFTATGTFSDSSTENITTTVTWRSSNTAVASISNTTGNRGLATAGSNAGTTTITAASGSVTSPGVTLTVTANDIRSALTAFTDDGSAPVTVTWNPPFADTNYTAACTVETTPSVIFCSLSLLCGQLTQ